MTRDLNRISSGFLSSEGGVDCGKSPNLLQNNQLAFATNCTVRGGFIKPRPGWKKINLSFEDEDVQSNFQDGRFQVSHPYNPNNGRSMLCVMIGGRLFRVNVDDDNSVQDISVSSFITSTGAFTIPAVGSSDVATFNGTNLVIVGSTVSFGGANFQVTAITSTTLTLKNLTGTAAAVIPLGTLITVYDLNPSNRPLAWATQAENYFIVQDGQSKALIYNGGTTRRADPSKKEVPTGSQITYGMGRIWIARNNEYIAGDISGGPTSVLQFTETGYLNEGGSFVVPLQSGLITGLKFISSIDTSLGQGELVIFTEQSVFSNRVPPNRATWKDSADAIQRIVQIDSGATSHRGVCGANGDLFYRSKEGIESLIVAVRQFGQWGNTPISREMNRVLEFDDRRLLQYASSIKFDNRLLMTCSPVETSHGVYHRGLIVLDFDLISSMGSKLPPAYDGLWTGLKILQLVDGMFSGIHRAFAFVLNDDNEIELWELTLDEKFDNGTQRIQWTFETPSYNFGNPFDLKGLETGDLSIAELVGQADMSVQFKSDQAPYWTDWHTWSECSKKEDCDIEECGDPKSYQPQYRSKMRLPQPPDTCEETNGKMLRHGYEFQMRHVNTGYFEFRQCRYHAYNLQESPNGECRSEGSCYGVNNCSTNVFEYVIQS